MDGPLVLLDTIFSRFAMSSSFLPMFSEFWLTSESIALISFLLWSMSVLKLAALSDRLPIFSSFFSMSSLLLARLVWRIVISFLLSSMSSLIKAFFYAGKKNLILNGSFSYIVIAYSKYRLYDFFTVRSNGKKCPFWTWHY